MPELTTIANPEQVDALIARSREHPVLVFKHSLICPISSAAYARFEDFVRAADGESPEFALIEVQPARAASNRVAERSGVRHESPQALLFQGGEVVWHASHGAITEDALRAATS